MPRNYSDSSSSTLKVWGASIAGTALIMGVITSSWMQPNPEQAEQILKSAGFKNIELKGHTNSAGCIGGRSEPLLRSKFEAVSPTGERVEGVICKSVLYNESAIRITTGSQTNHVILNFK